MNDKILDMKCPNCSQVLEIEDGLDEFFCKYCGSKIILDDDTRRQAKLRVKEMEHEYDMELMKNEERARQDRMSFKLIIIGVVACLLIFLVCVLMLS